MPLHCLLKTSPNSGLYLRDYCSIRVSTLTYNFLFNYFIHLEKRVAWNPSSEHSKYKVAFELLLYQNI